MSNDLTDGSLSLPTTFVFLVKKSNAGQAEPAQKTSKASLASASLASGIYFASLASATLASTVCK